MSTLKQKTVFKRGSASRMIDQVVELLPEIAFYIALGIRMTIAYILWMHSMELFSFIKDESVRKAIATALCIFFEAAFMTSSMVTAKLRMVGMAFWANWYLVFTIVGSLFFNGFFLYYFQNGAESEYIYSVPDEQSKMQIFLFLQFANIISIVMAEAVGFMLGHDKGVYEESAAEDALLKAKPKTGNPKEDFDYESLKNMLNVN